MNFNGSFLNTFTNSYNLLNVNLKKLETKFNNIFSYGLIELFLK